MLRLNVAAQQLEECVKRGMFALSYKPQIKEGELLLLQLKKSDWQSQGAKGGRISHALIFQRLEHDEKGIISKKHWPDAGKTWPWILYASAVLDVASFSLEDLPLKRTSKYQAQANPIRIDLEDEALILKYVRWPTASLIEKNHKIADLDAQYATANDIRSIEEFSVTYAAEVAKKWFPTAQVNIMKHNNPGFDILVTSNGKVERYIEVKGTRAEKPIFQMTETERRFSSENASIYSLMVVWNIDLSQSTCKLKQYDGEILVGTVIQPKTYTGQL